jgi:DNA-binding transcriptional LysR family regulator
VDLIHREADIALRLGEPTQGDLIARRLVTVGFGLYASQGYLDRAGVPDSVEALTTHRLVGLDAARERVETAMALPPTDPLGDHYSYLTNSPAAQMAAVRCGFGIGALSHRWAALVADVVHVLPEFTPTSMDMWLVTHEELRYSARIRAVSDYIAGRIREDARLFEHGFD